MDKLIKEFINKKLKEKIQHKNNLLREFVSKLLLQEKQNEQEFSKYPGINVLNRDVLVQIKDDIHTATKSLGDNTEFVEYFKKYVIMYLEDLIATSFDIDDVEDEISNIKTIINEVRLEVNPEEPDSSPIDNELFNGQTQDVEDSEQNDAEEDLSVKSTLDLPSGEPRTQKRSQMELPNGGQQDAKAQALDLLNNIDDIVIKGYNKVHDELNKELFLRYLLINILLHIDKAHNEMKDEPEDISVPGYEEEKEEVNSTEEGL